MATKRLSTRNLERLISNIQGDMSGFSSQAVCTFEEVYNNLETLDEKIGGPTYSPTTRLITIPSSLATYDSTTRLITLKV